jgi:hypothetical protein
MKLQYLTAAAFALMISSPAIADGMGQQFGAGDYLKGAQCSLHRDNDKTQVASNDSNSGESSGRSADSAARAAVLR